MRMGLFTRMREDIATVRRNDPAARNAFEIVTCYPGLHAIWIHRVAHWFYRRGWFTIARLVSHCNRHFTGVEIHPGARLGRRIFIDHGMGVVIGETTVIGNDVTLHQGVTLGGTSTQRVKRHPTLKDNVLVGVGAQVIGNIIIGENSKVGAGSVVLNSVPPNATVVGVPGRVVTVRNPDTDTVEKLPDPVGERLDNLEGKVKELENRLNRSEGRKGEGI